MLAQFELGGSSRRGLNFRAGACTVPALGLSVNARHEPAEPARSVPTPCDLDRVRSVLMLFENSAVRAAACGHRMAEWVGSSRRGAPADRRGSAMAPRLDPPFFGS
jgi:hypothetical protein